MIRAGTFSGYRNITASVLNKDIDSRHRATSLSTFNMIQKAPYVILAYPIGSVMDAISAKNFASALGVFMLIALVGLLLKSRPYLRKYE